MSFLGFINEAWIVRVIVSVVAQAILVNYIIPRTAIDGRVYLFTLQN